MLVTVYQDTNPESPTFGETKEERQENLLLCPDKTPYWVLTANYCETDSVGNYTSRRVLVYVDDNPKSTTYGSTRYEYQSDTVNCEPYDTDAFWVEISRECQQMTYPSGFENNSGVVLVTQEDQSPHSPTYGDTRVVEEVDTSACPLPDTTPLLVEISSECTGYHIRTIVSRDANIWSDTYLQEVSTEVSDSTCD